MYFCSHQNTTIDTKLALILSWYIYYVLYYYVPIFLNSYNLLRFKMKLSFQCKCGEYYWFFSFFFLLLFLYFCIFLPLRPSEANLQFYVNPAGSPTRNDIAPAGWRDAGFEPGTAGLTVWCTTNEPPHPPKSNHIIDCYIVTNNGCMPALCIHPWTRVRNKVCSREPIHDIWRHYWGSIEVSSYSRHQNKRGILFTARDTKTPTMGIPHVSS